jgi:hypothetical protein
MVDQPTGGAWGAPPPPPPQFPVPPRPGGWAPAPTWYRSLRGLAVATNILLGIAGALALVAIPVLANARSVVHDNASSSTFFATRDVRDALAAASGVLGLFFLVSIAIAVLWIIWMWRAATNTGLFGVARQRFSAGFAIGAWFIPLANFVIPGMQMADIWRGSPTDAPGGTRRSTALVWWWWITFLLGRITVFAAPGGVRLGRVYRLSDLDTRVALSIIGNVFVAVSAVLAILVVRRITASQESGAARLSGALGLDPFTAMAAPAPYPATGPYATPGAYPPAAYPPQSASPPAYPPAAYPPQPAPPPAYPPAAYPPQPAPPPAYPPQAYPPQPEAPQPAPPTGARPEAEEPAPPPASWPGPSDP